MTKHPAQRPRFRFDGPTPAARVTIALIFRLTLGLALLDAGITGYLKAGTARNGTTPAATGPRTIGTATDWWDGYARILPYVEVVVGVAVTIGFFTTAAATVAALWPVFLRTIKIVYALSVVPIAPTAAAQLTPAELFGPEALSTLLLAIAVIWTSSSGVNPLSIDALLKRPTDVEEPPPFPRTKAVSEFGHVTAEQIPSVPAVGSINPLVTAFDPGLYLEEPASTAEGR